MVESGLPLRAGASLGFQTTVGHYFSIVPEGLCQGWKGSTHFTDGQIKAQRDLTCPRSHSKLMSEQILGPLPAKLHHTVPENKKCPRHEEETPNLKKSPAFSRK